MIVILIIGLLLSIAVPQFITARDYSQKNACFENQKQLEYAKQHWILDTNQPSSSVPTPADLAPLYIKKYPVCPAGGTYVLGDGDTPVTCTFHAKP